MSLKRIDEQSVHQICSGQVVLTLAVAIKELVENSLDAGATTIEIRLKEYGVESFEVIDNGSGIEPENYQALTLKHFTSKISDFCDIATVESFGFRGEALSSLCALSDLVVVTCHKSQSVGSRIEYDNDGKIRNQSKCAREVGTTVSLSNLFHTLPVRQKEFHRNIKKEYGRMIHMLQGYCLISTGIKISCYGKNKKQLVLSSTGSHKIDDNISCVFGTKQKQQLLEIVQSTGENLTHHEGESPLQLKGDTRVQEVETSIPPEAYEIFKFNGYISRCTHGFGRSSTDRQFFFFNGRPCDHSKLTKTINEVYHIYNRHQYPFVLLNIETNQDRMDVNITPDKRQIMISEEKIMLAIIKESLINMFESTQRQFEKTVTTTSLGNSLSSTDNSTMLSSMKRSFSYSQSSDPIQRLEPKPKQPKLTDFGITKSQGIPHKSPTSFKNQCVKSLKPVIPDLSMRLSKLYAFKQNSTECKTSGVQSSHTTDLLNKSHDGVKSSHMTKGCSSTSPSLDSGIDTDGSQEIDMISCVSMDTEGKRNEYVTQPIIEEIKYDIDQCFDKERHSSTVQFNINHIAARLSHVTQEGVAKLNGTNQKYFHAKIIPECNQLAEEELKRELNKESFKSMKVIGQFNLGFIIAKLDNDLFIIDQHATDEKYNFERLQRDTAIDHQMLIQPLPLELTSVGESIVMENKAIFSKNGFEFEFNEEAPPTKRVKLIGQPVSKNWTMGVQEIEELIFMLTDYPGEMVRPACVNRMFATRACRGSIMIGTSLNHQEMKKLLTHMSELNQPWNCPHGRPTLRHILDLSKLSS